MTQTPSHSSEYHIFKSHYNQTFTNNFYFIDGIWYIGLSAWVAKLGYKLCACRCTFGSFAVGNSWSNRQTTKCIERWNVHLPNVVGVIVPTPLMQTNKAFCLVYSMLSLYMFHEAALSLSTVYSKSCLKSYTNFECRSFSQTLPCTCNECLFW